MHWNIPIMLSSKSIFLTLLDWQARPKSKPILARFFENKRSSSPLVGSRLSTLIIDRMSTHDDFSDTENDSRGIKEEPLNEEDRLLLRKYREAQAEFRRSRNPDGCRFDRRLKHLFYRLHSRLFGLKTWQFFKLQDIRVILLFVKIIRRDSTSAKNCYRHSVILPNCSFSIITIFLSIIWWFLKV